MSAAYGFRLAVAEVGGGVRSEQAGDSAREQDSSVWAALEAVYGDQYDRLVRLAALLLDDTVTAEDLVQEAFVALYARRNRLRSPDAQVSFLRRTVLARARSVRRRRAAVALLPRQMARAVAPAEAAALAVLDSEALAAALRRLPARQREAVILRYYADLSEAAMAEAMGISRGSVKVHLFRGLAALRGSLHEPPEESVRASATAGEHR